MLNLNVFSSEHSNDSLSAVRHASLQGPSSPEPSMLAATSVPPQVLLCQARSHFALDTFHLQMRIHVKKCILVRKGFDKVDFAAEIGNALIIGQTPQSLKFAGHLCAQRSFLAMHSWGGCCSQPQFPACAHPPEGSSLQGHCSFLGPVWAPCQS